MAFGNHVKLGCATDSTIFSLYSRHYFIQKLSFALDGNRIHHFHAMMMVRFTFVLLPGLALRHGAACVCARVDCECAAAVVC